MTISEKIENGAPRIALVTGANKGIGYEVSRGLGQKGLKILMGARDMKLGEASAARLRRDGLDVRALALDLTRIDLVHAAARTIDAEFGRLDVLVNNAAILGGTGDGPPSVADLDSVRRVFETNFFGSLAVTQAMLPLIRKSSAGRIVNVSSGLGSLTLNGDPAWRFAQYKFLAYNASKAALNMLTVQLASELRDTTIKVNAADPGFTATDLNDHRGTQTVEEGAVEPVRLALLPADGPTGGFFDSAGPLPW